jgi:hypothetical protein
MESSNLINHSTDMCCGVPLYYSNREFLELLDLSRGPSLAFKKNTKLFLGLEQFYAVL